MFMYQCMRVQTMFALQYILVPTKRQQLPLPFVQHAQICRQFFNKFVERFLSLVITYHFNLYIIGNQNLFSSYSPWTRKYYFLSYSQVLNLKGQGTCTEDAENDYAPLLMASIFGVGKEHLPTRQFIKNGSTDTSFDPPLSQLIYILIASLYIER